MELLQYAEGSQAGHLMHGHGGHRQPATRAVSDTAKKIMDREKSEKLRSTANTLQELKSKLKMMSYGSGGQDAMTLFRRYAKGSGSLSFDEFSAAVRKDGKMTKRKLSDPQLAQLFAALDPEKAGHITLEVLQAFVWARAPLGQVNGNSTPTPRGREKAEKAQKIRTSSRAAFVYDEAPAATGPVPQQAVEAAEDGAGGDFASSLQSLAFAFTGVGAADSEKQAVRPNRPNWKQPPAGAAQADEFVNTVKVDDSASQLGSQIPSILGALKKSPRPQGGFTVHLDPAGDSQAGKSPIRKPRRKNGVARGLQMKPRVLSDTQAAGSEVVRPAVSEAAATQQASADVTPAEDLPETLGEGQPAGGAWSPAEHSMFTSALEALQVRGRERERHCLSLRFCCRSTKD